MLYAYWLHQAEAIQGRRKASGGLEPVRKWSCLAIPAGFVVTPTLCVLFGTLLQVEAKAKALLLGETWYNFVGWSGFGVILALTCCFAYWFKQEYPSEQQ